MLAENPDNIDNFKTTLFLTENIYGHVNRLKWIISHLKKTDKIIEFGCGTGYMITIPLTKCGFDISGVDLDLESINYGRKILIEESISSDILSCKDFSDINSVFDVIIASEVLEHIPSNNLNEILSLLSSKLKPGGLLLVTVPNGYGCFEIENFLWYKVKLGIIMTKLRLNKLKISIMGENVIYDHPSTLSSSPHLQRFTYKSIKKLLIDNGFKIICTEGSVLFAGPFSNLLFTGINSIMNFNCFLGTMFPAISAGFYLAAKKIS